MSVNQNAHDTGQPVNNLEVRVAALEKELLAMKTALYAIPGALEKEKLAMVQNQKEFEKLQSTVFQVTASSNESAEAVSNLEKKVDTVKKESTSGVVVSVIVFSILLIISIFIRAA